MKRPLFAIFLTIVRFWIIVKALESLQLRFDVHTKLSFQMQ